MPRAHRYFLQHQRKAGNRYEACEPHQASRVALLQRQPNSRVLKLITVFEGAGALQRANAALAALIAPRPPSYSLGSRMAQNSRPIYGRSLTRAEYDSLREAQKKGKPNG